MHEHQQSSGGHGAGGKQRPLNITWEEELLLRGVRPDSDIAPLIQSAIGSPRSKNDGVNNPASSAAILNVVNGDNGTGYSMKGGRLVGSPRERPQMISPLRNISAKLQNRDPAVASPAGESVVGYSSDGGLSNTTQGRVVPLALLSPCVIVPSLLPFSNDDYVSGGGAQSPLPQRPNSAKMRSMLLPGGSLPPLYTDGRKDVDALGVSYTEQPNSKKLNPLVQSNLSTKLSDVTQPRARLSEEKAPHLGRRNSASIRTPLAPVSGLGKNTKGYNGDKGVTAGSSGNNKSNVLKSYAN